MWLRRCARQVLLVWFSRGWNFRDQLRRASTPKREAIMTRHLLKIAIASAILIPAFATAPAHAQATRTWVSGVGDDVNPCSRTAPCKTFAGAISKTFINGEIDCLDEGGFGRITITKSITIEGPFGGGFGSILTSGTNADNLNLTTKRTD